MRELYELKDKLCKELEEYGSKQLDVGSLDVIDRLSHAIKNLDKIIDRYEGNEYSGRYPMYHDGVSFARKRDSMGRYSRGRMGYSRADDTMITELREMMHDAPDDRTRLEFQNFISKLESM